MVLSMVIGLDYIYICLMFSFNNLIASVAVQLRPRQPNFVLQPCPVNYGVEEF